MWLLKPTHKHIKQEPLSEYLDSRLHGKRLERVEQQLGECDACRLELEELQATVAMMRQLPMETPRRSFVMSASPMELPRARPALVLRAPNWVYAGAAAFAALALAVIVSMDATGGLSSDPLRQDAAETALAPSPTPEQLAIPAAATAESTSETDDEGAAPPSLAAAAPAATTAERSVREESLGGGPPGGGAALASPQPPLATPAPLGTSAPPGTPTPSATTAPLAASAPADQDSEATIDTESKTEFAIAEPELTSVAPEARGTDGETSSDETQTTVENNAAKSLATEISVPVSETADPTVSDEDDDAKTSPWWRVLEAAAGVLAVGFLAGTLLRWRANRRDSV